MLAVDMKATGENMRNVMLMAGKTMRDLQDACGLTTTNAIYKWFNGDNTPTLDNLVTVADTCGVAVDEILVIRERP